MLDIEHGNPIGLVVSTRCSYFAPIAFPADVDVGLGVARLGRSSIHYRLGVFPSAHERAAAHGDFVHVVVDRETRRPVEVPAAWRARLGAIS
jgi:acyl-CoA thioester hydrolase